MCSFIKPSCTVLYTNLHTVSYRLSCAYSSMYTPAGLCVDLCIFYRVWAEVDVIHPSLFHSLPPPPPAPISSRWSRSHTYIL